MQTRSLVSIVITQIPAIPSVDIFTRLKDRLWVPHQAMFEFFENRSSVIASRSEEADQAIDELRKKSLELESVIRQWAKRIGLSAASTTRLAKSIHKTVDDIADKIEGQSSDDSFERAEDTAEDPVITSLTSILEMAVGDPLPGDELQAAKKEARYRLAEKIPPGWRDASKRKNPEGDYLIWHQMVREAKSRNADVLLITGDIKDDWWWREHGEARGPLPNWHMRCTQ